MFFSVVGNNLLLSLYVILFGGAALGCLLGAWRATQVRIPGVRRGLIGLLGTSAGWAALNVAFVLSPSLGMETAGQAWLYDFGLVSGFATVWAWLHLCSAISGQGLHRNRRVRIFAFVVFGGVTLTKLTNPLHELYFTTTAALDPFPHAAVNHHSLFWISLGLSYTLAAVGYFMLYEFLLRTRERTGPLVVLFGLMSLPAIANAIGYASPFLLDISHEPLGVAAFAVGVLFLYQDQFRDVSLVGSHDGPVLVVGASGHVRAYNEAATAVFPSLGTPSDGHGQLEEVLPKLSGATGEGKLITIEDGTRQRYYRVSAVPLGRDATDGGALVQLTEVTEQQQRWQLEEARHEGVAESLPGLEFQYRATWGSESSDPDTTYRHVGRRAKEVLGIASDPEDFEERFLARVPEAYHERYWSCTEGNVEEGQVSRAELPFNRPDGRQIWLLLSSQAERHRGPDEREEFLMSGIMLDITERKQARAQADLQTEVLRSVAEGKPLEETLSKLVKGLESLCPGMLGSVLVRNSREETLQHRAAPSLPDEYVRAVDGLPVGPEGGFHGTAAQSDEPVIVKDIQTDPRWANHRALALRHKLRASWSAPIMGSEGEVLGTFALYYRSPKAPSETDLALIEKARSLARIAIERDRNANRLRLLSESVEQSTEAVLITTAENLDPPGPEVVYVNKAFEEMTGYDRAEIRGKTPRVLQGPDTDRSVLDSLREALEAGEPWKGETVNYRKNGEPYRVQWKTTPVRGDDGSIQYWTAVQRDVTEQRRQEKALQERESQLQSVAENVSDAIYRSTEEDGIVYANQAFLDLFGYESLEEVRAMDSQALYADPGVREELLRKEEQNGGLSGEEVRYERKDGTTFVGLLSTRQVEVGEDAKTYYDGAITDITRRKRRERELVEAKQKAEEAARLKSAMMANMSHEIRTPLTSIIGFTEMMEEELEGRMGNFAEKIHRSSRRLMKTLDSVLELSRVEAGGYDLDREELDLRALVIEAPELATPSVEEKSVTIETRPPDQPVLLYGNEPAVRRILENLMGNAIKFTPEDGRVVVRAWKNENQAALEVEDTGIGMDPDEVENLFEPFKQASEGLNREYEGTGLGLSIVKRLAEAHGATIDVDTQKGEGSRFTIRFPRNSNPDDEE